MAERADVDLKEYVDRLLAERDKQVANALAANEKRLDGLNEIRQALQDRDRSFATLQQVDRMQQQLDGLGGRSLTREYYDQRHEELERRVGLLEVWQGNYQGRAVGLGVVGGIFIATATAVLSRAFG